ncbi:mannose-1-phosphate guanylyltransferase/mannose-6-phosphate isomerase [Selenomonas ruminantium]|uniref:mannose-1-phosphate guanylyltransferase/mannose-6-phosphate isomerase n=1 Tax=Selenomonas ruminantium TaxID=971 RepID=UPI000478DA71|nr:mannose-1-phosphate guanylyltransferase/mannose-6-phosphate isomerase [Selenomonas ruminantium]
MKVVILAGGGGSRLFPLSRNSYPKQFLCLEDDQSMLVHTIQRFLGLVASEDIVIVTGQQYLHHVNHELVQCHAENVHVVLEPSSHNTAPAIALAAKYCEDVLGCSSDEVLIVATADHVIRSEKQFAVCVNEAADQASKDALVVFGIVPNKPATGYGYIEAAEQEGKAFVVKSFTEKPSLEKAEVYLAAGNYYWNSGMFAFTVGFMMKEFQCHMPEIYTYLTDDYETMRAHFHEMPDISVDYAWAEKSQHVRMVPLACYWNDIGSWDAMYDILDKDKQGNAIRGDCLLLDCHNSLVMGNNRLIAGIGLDDLLLVETDDVIVIAKKGESQRVKEVVNELKAKKRKEVREHTTTYHEWGSSSVLGEGNKYRLKKIRVLPGHSLTMQLHYHRSEHWIVLSGTARIRRGDSDILIHENESVYIPPTLKHQLSNPGKIPLDIIEVQNGPYVGEDDIVRF